MSVLPPGTDIPANSRVAPRAGILSANALVARHTKDYD